MAELINRDHAAQAIEAYICSQCDYDTDRDPDCIACPHLDGDEILKSVPAVNRWIPCSERLPETIEPVIFSVERGYKQVCCGYRYGKHRMWKDRISGLHYTDYDVIAWMPMPDAYEPPEKTPES